MRSFIVFATLLTASVHPAFAEIVFPVAKSPQSIATILSDGISEPDSPASQVLTELAVALDKEGGIRVLSAAGYGGPSNARDLLQLRGTDFAILNSDVLAYLDLAKALPEARRKIRLIAPLFQQGVFLFASGKVKSVEELRGRKIGVPASRPSRGVTAKTIFGVLKIEASILELSDKDLASKAGELDAVLLYEKDLPRLRALGVTPATHNILPITVAGPLAGIYLSKKLGKTDIAGFSTAGVPETIQVAALLTAFDWAPTQGRYAEVATFAGKFFAAVPQIRATNPSSFLRQTDVRVVYPGWKRLASAEAPAAAVAPPPSKGEIAIIQTETAPDSRAGSAVLRVIALARPPFTNEQAKDGGIVLKILTGALNAAGIQTAVQWVPDERALFDAVFADKTAGIGLFAQSPHCDSPANQSAKEAELCDRAVLSAPLMQTVVGVFTRLDTPLNASNPDASQSHTLCVPEGQALTDEALAEIPGMQGAGAKTLRTRTLIDCLAAVERHEADALLAAEPEARFAIERLTLTKTLQISHRLGSTTGIHAIASGENPQQAALINTLNEALAQFKSNGSYSELMASHIADLTGLATMPVK